jgi:hypothetical protein
VDCGWRPARANSSLDSHLQNNRTKWIGGVESNGKTPCFASVKPRVQNPSPTKKTIIMLSPSAFLGVCLSTLKGKLHQIGSFFSDLFPTISSALRIVPSI